MALAQELASFRTLTAVKVSEPPRVGERAPVHPLLEAPTGSRTVIIFLRHCGCPYAERDYRQLCNLPAVRRGDVTGIIVSHSSPEDTEKWIEEITNDKKHPLYPPSSDKPDVAPGEPRVKVVVDPTRELYGAWGLGVSSAWHVFNPRTLASVFALGRKDGIWNRNTRSGSRWQTAGAFAVDTDGVVQWGHISGSASDIADLNEAVRSTE
ncbi:hypothetical protein ASPVEDRAFT_187810 [Aspergillus versicolor CBS 583.65]|uniref:Thioredoxin domain-containing protein n=1 Tax=Aspergillus versicolor CBS 583.65 TaxID=1036611 RepID=A0A1L9PDM9_ASPVE|nr:uncharacterized protein ASPVEDRAFT_187810 [Aspergillus versicolor CBS 583.65]OJI99554.1 hypothetical protein ASPVEDRAFT_187810 [Aspergillus versicolor CBS 583.65]